MDIFDFLNPKESDLPPEQQRWNKMWDLWADGALDSPYACLMTYQSEVNNGGHDQYFFNMANCGDLTAEVTSVLSLLPETLRENLQRGYAAFAAQEDITDDVNEALFSECDDVFYANEEEINALLEEFAKTIRL